MTPLVPLRRVLTLLALLVSPVLYGPGAASAHSASSSYLTLAPQGRVVQVQWEIALRDLDYAIGIDPDGDGSITWGEVRRAGQAIAAYALPRLVLRSDGRACTAGVPDLLADSRGDGGYAVLRFTETCGATVQQLSVQYDLLFDLDRLHRGLVSFVANGTSQVAALSPEQREVRFDAGGRLGQTLIEFFRVGVTHIFSGPDHLLFVAVLLFPAMFRRKPGAGWEPVGRFRPAFLETVRILSAFTVAHAITVTLASQEVIDVPARLVEGLITLTIVATAVDNIVPVLPGRRWMLAFGFGLIHGLGFAAALGPLSLPPVATAVALFAFNSGVEAAQLLVAVVVLPLGFALRTVRAYPRAVLPGASGIAALLAIAWFTERALGLPVRLF